MTAPVHVVGGGLAGLVAAITAAEAGAPVVLHEASGRLGGRARSETGPYRVNLGPHVVFTDGVLVRWCARRNLLPRLVRPSLWGNLVVGDTGARRIPDPAALVQVVRHLGDRAPVDLSFTEWAGERMGPGAAAELSRLAGLLCFHHDPGSLSARFVWDHLRRRGKRLDQVRDVAGGWSSLVEVLATRAVALGVQVELRADIGAGGFPEDGPVVVATPLTAASTLLGRPLAWPGSRTAVLDVATTGSVGSVERTRRWPGVALDLRSDLRTCCLQNRVTAADLSVAPPGVELIQAQLGVGPGATLADGVARIEASLDASFPGWRAGERWRRELLADHATGAVDPPGATWRDRPAIDQGGGRFLAGDLAAAPGLLSEVSVNSAVRAAHLALEHRRQAVFAPGWPGLALSPVTRVQVLAQSLPIRAEHRSVVPGPLHEVWSVPPALESGPQVQVRQGRWFTVVTGAAPGPDGSTEVAGVVGTGRRFPAWARPLLAAWARRAVRRSGPGAG